jgi:epimerase transport system membrane fusion protein
MSLQNTMGDLQSPATDDYRYIKKGLIVVFLIFGVFGIWAITAKLDSGVPLSGKVVVESDNKIIQHLEGGIIEKIYVDDGDYVKQGDILLKFDDTKSKTQLQSLQAKYYETLALRVRLNAENEKKDVLEFPKEFSNLSSQKAEELKKAQRDIFKNTRNSLSNQKKITKQKVSSLQKHIDSLNETILSKQLLLKSYQEEAKEQEDLYAERLIDKTKLREVTRQIESLQADIDTTKAEITKAQIQINEVQTELALNQEDFYKDVKKQLRDAETSIEDLRAKIIETKDRLSRTFIRAPQNGTVLNLQVHTIGAVVESGKSIMEIVPENSQLIIRATLHPQYRDYVKVGLKANITFPAFQLQSSFIKRIQGEVIFVAADSTRDKEGNEFYTIKLIIDKEGQKTLKKEDMVLQAGMPASVVIKTGKQTTFEYLVRPISMMLDRAMLEK